MQAAAAAAVGPCMAPDWKYASRSCVDFAVHHGLADFGFGPTTLGPRCLDTTCKRRARNAVQHMHMDRCRFEDSECSASMSDYQRVGVAYNRQPVLN